MALERASWERNQAPAVDASTYGSHSDGGSLRTNTEKRERFLSRALAIVLLA